MRVNYGRDWVSQRNKSLPHDLLRPDCAGKNETRAPESMRAIRVWEYLDPRATWEIERVPFLGVKGLRRESLSPAEVRAYCGS